MECLAQRLIDLFAKLGDTPEKIAATLDRDQIWGVRNTVRFLNPIVRHLQRALALGPFNVDLMEPETVRVVIEGAVIRTELPEPVKQFLLAFNQGAYPALEAEGVPGRLEVLVPFHP